MSLGRDRRTMRTQIEVINECSRSESVRKTGVLLTKQSVKATTFAFEV